MERFFSDYLAFPRAVGIISVCFSCSVHSEIRAQTWSWERVKYRALLRGHRSKLSSSDLLVITQLIWVPSAVCLTQATSLLQKRFQGVCSEPSWPSLCISMIGFGQTQLPVFDTDLNFSGAHQSSWISTAVGEKWFYLCALWILSCLRCRTVVMKLKAKIPCYSFCKHIRSLQD